MWTANASPPAPSSGRRACSSPVGEWLRAPTDRAGRVLVGPDLTIPDDPEVFAIGDTASASQDGAPLPGIAPVAMQQGHYAATAIRRRIAGERAIPPFHYFDKGTMATVGRSFAVARIRRLSLSGFLAWALWLGIHILFLIGFRNRAGALPVGLGLSHLPARRPADHPPRSRGPRARHHPATLTGPSHASSHEKSPRRSL